jgi:hypothetical protein
VLQLAQHERWDEAQANNAVPAPFPFPLRRCELIEFAARAEAPWSGQRADGVVAAPCAAVEGIAMFWEVMGAPTLKRSAIPGFSCA